MTDQTEQRRYPRNRALHARRRLAILSLGVATYCLGLLLTRAPTLVESLYGSGFGPRVVRFLAVLTGWASFSVGEILVIGYLLFQIRAG
ncbi:MAG: hypothetical protein PVJ04_15910, partial [Gemmatimonadota bacterium]